MPLAVLLVIAAICAMIFFPIVLLSGKLFGETGIWVSQFILIFGSLALIGSLPVLCYACIQFIGQY